MDKIKYRKMIKDNVCLAFDVYIFICGNQLKCIQSILN